jgi:Domain of unknown function (DUF222)
MRCDIDRREAIAARFLAAVHLRGIPAGDGASSTPPWVQSETGQRWGDARASLDAGLACESMPLMAKAWEQGEISTSAVRTITRGQCTGHEAVYLAMEETLVDFAAARDFRGLDASIRYYQTRAKFLDDKDPRDLNGLHLSRVGNRWALNADLDDYAGTTLNEAVNAAMDKPSDGDTRSADKRRADALTRIGRFFLDHANLPMEGGERPHITIVLGYETALNGSYSEYTNTAFAPADIRQMLCDARISRIIMGPQSIPLDAGHATHTPSKAMRRAIAARDKGCRFHGCGRPPSWCEAHHVTAWPIGETTRRGECVFPRRVLRDCGHLPGALPLARERIPAPPSRAPARLILRRATRRAGIESGS